MSQPKFRGGPKDELASQEAHKEESKLTSSLGSRGMSQEQMMGKPELKSLISGMKGSISGAVKGFLGRIMGK